MKGRRVLLVGHQTSHEVLTAARDLALSGWEVHVATGAKRSLAGASRFVSSEHRVGAPDVDLGAFTRDVILALDRCKADVVIGCGDPELLSLSAVRAQVPALVPLAAHHLVLDAVDKVRLTSAAAHVGLAVPRTEVADAQAVQNWQGPAIVKPRLHWHPGLKGTSAWASASLATSRTELIRAVQAVQESGREPVLQEPIIGGLIAVSAVRNIDGRLTGLLQQRATRTWPRQTGVSSRAVTTPIDPALADGVRRLLEHLGWVGMVQLQFLQPPSGPPRLLDLNGRPYGSLSLAGAAGLPLLALWLDDATPNLTATRPSDQVLVSRSTVTYSHGGKELQRAWAERRGGLRADLVTSAQAWWGAAHPVANRDDVRPLLRMASLAATGHSRSAAGRILCSVRRRGLKTGRGRNA